MVWIKFSERQPEKEGDYLIYTNGQTRIGTWHDHGTTGLNPGCKYKYFTIFPIDCSEEGGGDGFGGVNIYEEYVPDYWAEINPPLIKEKEIVMPEKPLCKDCRWKTWVTPQGALCAHPKAPRSLVDGTPRQQCVDLRSESDEILVRVGQEIVRISPICGSAGGWFEAAPRQ